MCDDITKTTEGGSKRGVKLINKRASNTTGRGKNGERGNNPKPEQQSARQKYKYTNPKKNKARSKTQRNNRHKNTRFGT